MKKTLLTAPSNLYCCYTRTVFAILLLVGFATTGFSQTTLQTNYTFSESVNPANYVDLGASRTIVSAAGVPILTNITTVNVPLPVDFIFNYNNDLVTHINIFDNGHITLANTAVITPATTPNTIINDATTASNYIGAIAAFSSNLFSNATLTTEISYEMLGMAPNRVFVVQYKNIRRGVDAGSPMNMQIRINESDKSIETVYKENFNSPITAPTTSGQVGLRGATNADFYNRKKSLVAVPAGSFVVGQQYQILIPGSTIFTAIGAANNSSPTNFVATGAGSGTGNARVLMWPGADGTVDGDTNGSTLALQGSGALVSAGSFVVGQQYQIVLVGTTSFTSIGASANTVGIVFTATGVGAGTGTANSFISPFVIQGYQAGTKFTWSPCFRPTSIVAAIQADNSTLNISWTAASYLAVGGSYDWEVRTSGAAGSGATGLFASGNTTSTSVSVLGLAIGIDYYVYLKRNCASLWLPASPRLAGSLLVGQPCQISWVGTSSFIGVGASANTVGVIFNPTGSTIGNGVVNMPFRPACTIATVPYTQNFEGAVAPNIPNCNSVINSNVPNPNIVVDNSSSAFYGFGSKNFTTTNAAANAEWFFTQGITLPVGSYRLSYKYGGTRELSFLEQKMRVYTSTDILSGLGTKVLLADHNSIKASPLTNVVNFTITTPGTYYIAFNGYADASNGFLQLDDISVTVSTCLKPTALSSGQITATTAIIAWGTVASASAGYDYYYAPASGATFTAGSFVIGQTYQILTIGSTDYTLINGVNTVGTVFTANGVGVGTGTARLISAPSSSTIPSGSVAGGTILASLGSLTPSTTYNFWVRSQCGGGDVGEWSAGSAFTTPAIITYTCAPAGPSGAGFAQDPSGITNVTMGSINNPSGLEANAYGNYTSLITNVSQTATVPVSITYETGYTYDTMIWVDWNNDGDFTDSDETVYTGVSTNGNPTTLSASFVVPTLNSSGANTIGPHRIRIGGIDAPTYAGGALTPCRNGAYQTFEDYTIFVVVAPPALTISAASASICEGQTTPALPATLTVSVVGGTSLYQVYNWTPNIGVSGNIASGYNFAPTATTIYTLTATQTSGNFSSTTATYTVTVIPLPTPIVVTPVTATSCSAQTLTAVGGVISGVEVFNEKFNGGSTTFTRIYDSLGLLTGLGTGTGTATSILTATTVTAGSFIVGQNYQILTIGTTDYTLIGASSNTVGLVFTATTTFTTTNSSSGSNPLASNWTLTNLTNTTNETITSNDGSQFYLSDSDQQGGGGLTNTELISPVFSLAGFSDAVLNFWHYYKALGGSAEVQISTNGGSSYATLPGAVYTTTQGSGTSFNNVNLNLTAYIGQTNLRIKFKYINAPYAWWWAIDNVKVSGASSSTVVWSPTAGLYTDAAATVPYTGTPALVVYAKPTISTVYSASAASGGCTRTSNTATINVTSVVWNGASWSNVTGPTSSIGADFQGDFTSATHASATLGNLSACNVVVTSGNVLFNRGTLTVQNTVNVSGGSLTFDDVSYDVSLYQPNAVANAVGVYSGGNSGNITFRRTSKAMYKFDYTYWSSPVYPQNLLAVSPGSPTGLFLSYNSTWQYIASPSTTTMAVGQGYAIRAPLTFNVGLPGPTSYQAPFSGEPNNGTLSIPINSGGGVVNLLGNPYPSGLSASQFTTLNPNLNGSLYFWTHNTPIGAFVANQYSPNDYAIWNTSGAIRSAALNLTGVSAFVVPSGNIASGQGFFVEGMSGTSATYTNAMRVSGNNNDFFKTNGNTQSDSDLERHRYWLDITNAEGAFKEALIGYVETATLDVDRLFDGKLVDAGNVISLYTNVGATKLSIQGRPLPFEVSDLVPLSYKSTIASAYTISIPHYDGLFDEQHVYLEDKLLNVIHDLTTSGYTFATAIGTFDDRFVLRYTTQSLGTDNPVFTENSVVVYKNNEGLFVNTGNVIMQKVTVYDVRGRTLATQKQVGSSTTVFTNLPTTQQVLLVKIEGENGAIVIKKIVF